MKKKRVIIGIVSLVLINVLYIWQVYRTEQREIAAEQFTAAMAVQEIVVDTN